MRHRRAGVLVTAVVASLALAGAASGAATQPVRIDLHVNFETGVETFTATGFCPEGTAESFGFHQAGQGRATTFHLFKTLTCEDDSGTLTIRVEASSVFGFPGTIGGWSVVGGTGDYANTMGGGKIVGTGFDGGIDDVYTGRLTG
jgi:hypothetical protein